MVVQQTSLKGVLRIKPAIYRDERGFFLELHREGQRLPRFVQDNFSFSRKGVLRGLHFQHPRAQGKLVCVLEGEIYDVVVDLRLGSPTFGQWMAERLSMERGAFLFVPPGFAHGFCVLSEKARVFYKCTEYYYPEDEKGIRFDDPELHIPWPVRVPIVSEKDKKLPSLKELKKDELFVYCDSSE